MPTIMDIDAAINKANNPDLNYKERKALRFELRSYISEPNQSPVIISRLNTALSQVLDHTPWYLNPWFVGLSCSTIFFLIGFLSK